MPGLLRADYHTHTCFSDGGRRPESTPRAMVQAAREAGLEAVGLTDHVNTPEHRALPGLVRAQVAEVREGVRVYVGCEAQMEAPDRASIDASFAAEMDYVIMSASHLYGPGLVAPPVRDAPELATYLLALIDGAIASGLADIIAHPFGVPSSKIEFPEVVQALDPDALMRTARAAAAQGIAFELNPAFVTWVPELAGWLFGRFLEAGAKLAIGSDAHTPEPVGCRGPEYATEARLRALGVREDLLWHPKDRPLRGQLPK